MTATLIRRKYQHVLLAGFIAVSLTACSTPEGVQQFTSSAKNAAAQLPPIVRDISSSCMRKQFADRKPNEIADSEDLATANCKELAALEPQVLAALTVLTAYLNSLNQLASNNAVSYDKEIDGIVEKVQSAGKFGDPEVAAVKGLAKFLFDATASGYQRKKLAAALLNADKDVEKLTKTLGQILGDDYGLLLSIEERALQDRYRSVVAPEKSGATQLLIQDRWRTDLASVKAKRAAAAEAKAALTKIGQGHHELAQAAGRWDAAQLYKILNPYAASIQSLAADFKAAF